jgi:pimeloyl-ACP methyl ester carboxylesterase/DNA-binding CsgD family transcriptional regulator
MRPPVRYARSGSTHIAWQETGEGPVDLVFAHGWMSHLEAQWDFPEIASFLERLARSFRLIIFDKRGTGLSDRVFQPQTLEQRIDDVRAVMDAAKCPRALIMGISEAAALALLFAASHPDRTRAVISYGGYARRVRAPDYPWAPTLEQRERYFDKVLQWWGGAVDLSTLAPSRAGDPEFIARFAALLRQSASPGAAVALARMNTYVDIREQLALISCPALILHRAGDKDPVPEESRYIAGRIPGATFRLLPGADHWPYVGDADSVLSAVEDFLAALPEDQPIARKSPASRPRVPGAMESLTPRQRDILALMAQGRSNRDIANLLSRSEHTIHRHVANILDQLGVRSRAAAVALAAQDIRAN